jgi:hypothetical protein
LQTLRATLDLEDGKIVSGWERVAELGTSAKGWPLVPGGGPVGNDDRSHALSDWLLPQLRGRLVFGDERIPASGNLTTGIGDILARSVLNDQRCREFSSAWDFSTREFEAKVQVVKDRWSR